MRASGWNVQVTRPSEKVTSMNNVTAHAQQSLEFANTADVVFFGSGIHARDIAKEQAMMSRLKLDKTKQLICSQCSGTLQQG